MTAIIVPSRYPDIFADCLISVNRFAPQANKIVVRDGLDITPPEGWQTVEGIKPFVYARNVNLGINKATGNVLLMNDDVRFTHPSTTENLEALLAGYPDIGILSPKTVGLVGNDFQSSVTRPIQYTDRSLCFVCVLIRREVIDKIGLLDERFTGYGWDDMDYCRRAASVGYKFAVTANSTVTHGHAGHACSSSYSRNSNYSSQVIDAREIYQDKWGDNRFSNFTSKVKGAAYDRDGLTRDWWDTHQ